MSPEIQMLERAMTALGPLVHRLVFVGGSVIELLQTDPAAPAPRATDDVDAFTPVATLVDFYRVEEEMRGLGFDQAPSDTVFCRWRGHGLTIDLVPARSGIFGQVNRWYESGLTTAQEVSLPSGAVISILDGPHMLASKLEAYQDRGKADPYSSHDLEDIILLVDGRPELSSEVSTAPFELRTFVAAELAAILRIPGVSELIESCLLSAGDSVERLEVVYSRIRTLLTEPPGDSQS